MVACAAGRRTSLLTPSKPFVMIRLLNLPVNTFAVVVRHGAIAEVLAAGRHVVLGTARVRTYPTYGRFDPPPGIPLEVAVTHPALAEMLDVVRVPEGSLAVVFREDVYAYTLGPGLYAYLRGPIDFRVELVDLMGVMAPPLLVDLLPRHPELRAHVRELLVPAGRRGLLFVNGALHSEHEAGAVVVVNNDTRYELKAVPLGVEGIEVNGHEMLTADKASVRVNYYFRYRITDARRAVIEVSDYVKELRVAAALALREYIGGLSLDALLTSKVAVNEAVASTLTGTGESLGAAYVDGGIRDIILPGEMRTIVNRVLVAEKTAEANAISRRDEAAATRTLLNAAKLMDEHPMLRRLKEMEYVERVAERVDRITVAGGGDVMGSLRELLVPEA